MALHRQATSTELQQELSDAGCRAVVLGSTTAGVGADTVRRVNLYPTECEQVLIRHNTVSEVAVIGIPDRDMGEALHALVVAATPDIDLDELDDFCRRELAGFKCPHSYELVDELRRNEMGKVDKRSMRSRYWGPTRTTSG